MNLILINENDFLAENLVKLTDFRFEHVKKTLKGKTGDSLKIGLLNDKIGAGKILEIDEKSVSIECVFNKKPPRPHPCVLFCALPRPKVFRRVLLNAVCFGVKEIHFFQAFKVEKSYWQSPFLSQKSLDEITQNALMQSVDTVLPQIYFHKRYKIFAEDVFAQTVKKIPCFVFHPTGESQNLPEFTKSRECGLVIGPEGGFTDYEIETFLKTGAKTANMGERILRVEQAVSAALSRFLF